MGEEGSEGSPQLFPGLSTTVLASAAAGVCARVPCHPIDTVKARMQAPHDAMAGAASTHRSLVRTLTHVVRSEGVAGLYRGVGVAVVGSGPAACLYLTSYEQYKARLSSLPVLRDRHRFIPDFLAGFAAEATSCCLWVPIDVTKERLQVQDVTVRNRYRSSPEAVSMLWRHEGFRGMYKGYFSTLASFGPFSALYFMFYEEFKDLYATNRPSGSPFWQGLLCGGAASALASALTNPMDMAKLRLQVQRAVLRDGASSSQFHYEYRSFPGTLAAIVREEGVLALWRGVSARVLFAGPQAALTFGLFEVFKTYLL